MAHESGIRITEPRSEALDLTDANVLAKFIITDLCGERYFGELSSHEARILADLTTRAAQVGLDCAEFNEMLLLLNQDRVSKDFFDFFWQGPRANLNAIRDGITRFRGFALLRFGNFRFAYRYLGQLNRPELFAELGQYAASSDELLDAFRSRPEVAVPVTRIARDKTWLLGYISKGAIEGDMTRVNAISGKETPRKERERLLSHYKELGETRVELEEIGLVNTDIYLTWDYMDVYVATSMRQRSEFAAASDFIGEVFGSAELDELKLRWFDPTQSVVPNRIDKGLVEALMLNRAACTVYMAQEYDTMGKDSELAATLAQGKPVVVYVPGESAEELAELASHYPPEFLERRLLLDRAEGLFEDPAVQARLGSTETIISTVESFLKALREYRSRQPLILWEEANREWIESLGDLFKQTCEILGVLEHRNYEKRADGLRKSHPLALQVSLSTGVANGVLLVRNASDCAKLVRGLLCNALDFNIEQEGPTGATATVLRESISGCVFRVVTEHEKLTNSFWNFYLSRKGPSR